MNTAKLIDRRTGALLGAQLAAPNPPQYDQCPTCGHTLELFTVDGRLVERCAPCRREGFVAIRRDAPQPAKVRHTQTPVPA